MFFFCSSSLLFPQVLVCSRKDCFTCQSPGLWEVGRRWPSPSQSSSGGSWKAAGAGGVEGCLGEHLAKGGFVSLHVGMDGAILSQQAGRECLHRSAARLGKAVQREMRVAESEACKRGGACRACAWAISFFFPSRLFAAIGSQ